MSQPFVTVICLCYNHAAYVSESIRSVLEQTYQAVELIVVDDASADGSQAVIEESLKAYPDVRFIALEENQGNCKAFNTALKEARGKYIIDLAADDVLCAERIEVGIKALEKAGGQYAVHFSDAYFINESSEITGSHYPRDKQGKLLVQVPHGEVYADLLARYFLCTPTMMMRHSVLKELDGYDETLAYEDFDFWIRSARNYHYLYTDRLLVKKRILKTSLSATQYERKSRMLESTLKVCRKAYHLNRCEKEQKALAQRLRYELRQAVLSGNTEIAGEFLDLLKQTEGSSFFASMMGLMIRSRINWRLIRKLR